MAARIKWIAVSVLCASLIACAPVEEEPAAPATHEARVCPADGYLNCMPIIPPQRQAFCSADYRSWIVGNCPDVEIVF